MKTDKCRACPAVILWATAYPTDKTPKPRSNPLDCVPSPDGNLRLDETTLRYTVLTGDELKTAQANGERLFISHFATCPKRQNFRKTKPGMTLEEARELGTSTREQYLERLPKMAEILAEYEKRAGLLLRCNSTTFDDGRIVMIFKHERAYLVVFWNPKKPKSRQESNFWLTYESMSAMNVLYGLLKDEKDTDALKANLTGKNLKEREAANG